MPNLNKRIYPTFKDYLKEEYEGPFMATDIIARYKRGVVLIERKNPPFGIALPGGIAERMQLHNNAKKEGLEETGLVVRLDDPDRPLCVLSRVHQDPRAFIATAVYTGEGFGELKPRPEEDAKNARVYTEEELADLVKDKSAWAFPHHRKAIQIYLNWRKNESR